MSPTLTTFLFEGANFLVLAAVLGWLFFKPVRQVLADRRTKLAEEEQQASEKLAKASRAQQQIDEARGKLQVELNEFRKREQDAARNQAEQLLTEARTAAAGELEAGRRQAARLSETQQDTLGEAAAVAAAEMVGKLLEELDGPDIHQALLQSACRQLQALPRDPLAPVKVESARPLTEQDRMALDEALGPAAATAKHRTVEKLGVGIRVSTAQGLIDASALWLVGFARQSLIREMNHRANHHNPLQFANDE